MITSLIGSNGFALLQNKKQKVDNFIKNHGDLSVERFESDSDKEVVRSALLNLPFLVEKKLIIFDEPSKSKELIENLIEWLVILDEKTDVLIIEPNPDKRTAWYKFLQKHTDLIPCNELDDSSTRKWILEIVKEMGGTIEGRAASVLIDYSGLNQQQLYNDIIKLINYNANITNETVDLLVEPLPQDTIFSLLEALAHGNSNKTLNLYDSLRQSGVDANEILAMLGWQLHTLLLVKSSLTTKGEDSGLHPYVIQKNLGLVNRLRYKDIEELISLVISAELSIKKEGLTAPRVVGVLLNQMLDLIKNRTV